MWQTSVSGVWRDGKRTVKATAGAGQAEEGKAGAVEVAVSELSKKHIMTHSLQRNTTARLLTLDASMARSRAYACMSLDAIDMSLHVLTLARSHSMVVSVSVHTRMPPVVAVLSQLCPDIVPHVLLLVHPCSWQSPHPMS